MHPTRPARVPDSAEVALEDGFAQLGPVVDRAVEHEQVRKSQDSPNPAARHGCDCAAQQTRCRDRISIDGLRMINTPVRTEDTVVDDTRHRLSRSQPYTK